MNTGDQFRSIFCGRWMGRIHHTLVCWSTSAGRWRGKRGWSHRSIQSICVLVEQWSWSSWLVEPGQRFPSACGQQYLGTLWCLLKVQYWRTSISWCPHHTSWCCCRWSRGYLQLPYPGSWAGTWPTQKTRKIWWECRFLPGIFKILLSLYQYFFQL